MSNFEQFNTSQKKRQQDIVSLFREHMTLGVEEFSNTLHNLFSSQKTHQIQQNQITRELEKREQELKTQRINN